MDELPPIAALIATALGPKFVSKFNRMREWVRGFISTAAIFPMDSPRAANFSENPPAFDPMSAMFHGAGK
jgi:hypothetical protein